MPPVIDTSEVSSLFYSDVGIPGKVLPSLLLIRSALSAHDALSLADFPKKSGLRLREIISNNFFVVNKIFNKYIALKR